MVVGGGALAMNATSGSDRSTELSPTPVQEAALLKEAMLLIEAECGSAIRTNTKGGRWISAKDLTLGKPSAGTVVGGTKVNSQGESLRTRHVQVSNMYVNGCLHRGTVVVQMKFTGWLLFQEWVLDEVHVDVQVSAGETIHASIYPPSATDKKKKDASKNKTPSSFGRRGSLFLTKNE